MTTERCHHTRITQDCPYCLVTDEREETVEEVLVQMTIGAGATASLLRHFKLRIEAALQREREALMKLAEEMVTDCGPYAVKRFNWAAEIRRIVEGK